jgi:hypothetical protein
MNRPRQSIHENYGEYLAARRRELEEERCSGCGQIDGCTCEPESMKRPEGKEEAEDGNE